MWTSVHIDSKGKADGNGRKRNDGLAHRVSRAEEEQGGGSYMASSTHVAQSRRDGDGFAGRSQDNSRGSPVNLFQPQMCNSDVNYSSTAALGDFRRVDVISQAPSPRAAHSCDLIGNKLYIFGGWNGERALNDLHVLDLETRSWSLRALTGDLPSSRNNHAIAMVGIKLFIHGGHDGEKWLDDMYTLDTDRGEWHRPLVSGSKPSARACHTLTRIGRKLYMFGGYDGEKCFNDVDVLDLDTLSWMQPRVTGAQPKARNAHTMTAVRNSLFLFGGHSGSKHLDDLHILDTAQMHWSTPNISGSAPPGLRGHTANMVGNKMVLFGGYDGRGRSNALFLLNLDILKWDSPSSMEGVPAGRQRHTACLVGSKKLYIFGGFDGYQWLNDLHVLDVSKLEEKSITSHATHNLIDNMKRLYNNPDLFPDIVFVVQGRRVYAHKAILAMQCDQFGAMFKSGMRESREAEITIPSWTHEAFVRMLEFLYTGSIESFKLDFAIDLLGLSDHYTLGGLKRLCENKLTLSVDAENCASLFRAAHRYGAQDLKKYCMNYMLLNFEHVSASSSFEDLSAEPALLLEVTRESMKRSQTSNAGGSTFPTKRY